MKKDFGQINAFKLLFSEKVYFMTGSIFQFNFTSDGFVYTKEHIEISVIYDNILTTLHNLKLG